MASFFERFRAELARYAHGVHNLAPPAPARELDGLPEPLASFYRSWNGGDLFVDALTIRAASACSREDGLLVFADSALGDRFALDEEGRVHRIEEDTGEALIEGTSFERWLDAAVTADGVLYDREGEFKEGLFEDDGEEMAPAIVEKRERKALKIDPDAPAPAWRLARALDKLGRPGQAIEQLQHLVDRWPTFAWAWFDLGKLLRAEGRPPDAERAFARAAEADPSYEHAGWFAAHAARSAASRGDDAARANHAARALDLAPDLAAAQKEAARRALAEGLPAAAREAAELAAALAPRDLEILDLLRRLPSHG
jgi:tetratricopeptide (TPR) repeat protein